EVGSGGQRLEAAGGDERPRRAGLPVVAGSAHHRGAGVGRERNGETLPDDSSSRIAADQLVASLDPTRAAAAEHPCRSHLIIVVVSPLDGGIAVGGECNGGTLENDASLRAGADQLGLLAPHSAAAGEHPHRSDIGVVGRSTLDGGVAVAGERDGVALRSSSSKRLHAGAEKLGLLAPHSAAIGEHPCGASTIVVGRPADHGRAAVAGERDGKALPGGTYRVGSNRLGLLGPRPGAASEYPCRPY